MPKEFAARPAFQMQHAIAGKEIEEGERAALKKGKVSPVDQFMTPKGDMVYSTVPIPRDEFGNPDLATVAAAGNLWVVKSVEEGDKIIQKAQQVKP